MFGKGVSSSKSMEIIGSEKKFSVLIVDDDPIIRKIHSALLSKFTKEIQDVKNGKEAVDLYRSGASFDIIFIDKEMPIMNGLEATKELRAMGVNSTIVGVTSCDLSSERNDFIAAGQNQCYEKPLTIEKIESLLSELNKNN
ncbi:two-component response regulator 24-like [Castanea sativa]|uniref:two-component response regulator 24-like n=1 Tax=Castanea sativa TaxID=21020 RepID=UPI003F64FCC4